MTFDVALRTTEILLALAFLQQSAEHVLGTPHERIMFLTRGLLAVALLLGAHSQWILLALTAHSLLVLHRFHGPYNGGSDRMGLLVLYCTCLASFMPPGFWQEAAFGYLGLQLVLSYFFSGQVKICNPDWRSGQALSDVFRFSAYPVSETLRKLADQRHMLWAGSWAVMIFEVLFPFSLLDQHVLAVSLGFAALFHVSNACFFGLNRFVWFWISAYPSIFWLQSRLVQIG